MINEKQKWLLLGIQEMTFKIFVPDRIIGLLHNSSVIRDSTSRNGTEK